MSRLDTIALQHQPLAGGFLVLLVVDDNGDTDAACPSRKDADHRDCKQGHATRESRQEGRRVMDTESVETTAARKQPRQQTRIEHSADGAVHALHQQQALDQEHNQQRKAVRGRCWGWGVRGVQEYVWELVLFCPPLTWQIGRRAAASSR